MENDNCKSHLLPINNFSKKVQFKTISYFFYIVNCYLRIPSSINMKPMDLNPFFQLQDIQVRTINFSTHAYNAVIIIFLLFFLMFKIRLSSLFLFEIFAFQVFQFVFENSTMITNIFSSKLILLSVVSIMQFEQILYCIGITLSNL